MKLKKLLCLLLALCMLVPSVFAADAEEAAVQTVRALGIMVGDEQGNLNLSRAVTRAEFTKMLVAASNQRDAVRLGGTGYAVFSDVGGAHWASDYIRIAANQGWIIGYTDGSFRPNNNIKLEEACTAALRLIGYDASTLVGAFPAAQLSKAAELGLRNQILRTRGETMTRLDCARLFANLLTAKTAAGAVYCTTLGFPVANGSVDLAAAVQSMLAGPFVAQSGTTLPFSPVTVYRNGTASTSATLQESDVYYYSERNHALWICTERVSGTLTALLPTAASPSTVTVAGNTYPLTGTAAYRLSSLSGDWLGKTVTLLLGLNGEVVDVLTGNRIDETYYGVVQTCVQTALDAKNANVETKITMICTDGVTRTFTISRKANYDVGTLLSANVRSDGTEVDRLVTQSLSGTVSADGKTLDSNRLAADIRILDTEENGAAVRVAKERIYGLHLSGSDVRFYERNAKGEIETLILRSVTGDCWNYGYVTDRTQFAGTAAPVVYTAMLNGQKIPLRPTGNLLSFPVSIGGCAVCYATDGSVSEMRQLASAEISSLSQSFATANSKRFELWDGVQVYLLQGGEYYLTTLSAVNTENYRLTGWYDNFTGAAGGKIRIVVAVRK